jgi:hypothetical protein
MPAEPLHFVRAVEDHMVDFSGRDARLDCIQEADEHLMAVTLHAASNHLAFEYVERREELRRSVPLLVMGHRAGASLLHGQAGPGAIERLNLRLLVDRQHDGMRSRVDIQADNIGEILAEASVPRQFERVDAMGRKAMRRPDALDRTQADPGSLGCRARPVCRLAGQLGKRQSR